MAFVPLHNHSDYSLLDGASQLPQMVERAKELGMPALALTDHGVMYGAVELLKLCQGTGIKPIIGNEMYVVNGSIDDPQQKKERRYHLVVSPLPRQRGSLILPLPMGERRGAQSRAQCASSASSADGPPDQAAA